MKIVLATFGSLGDLHPMIALGIELRRRGHAIVFASVEAYREKINLLGFEFHPIPPDINPEDRDTARRVMDEKTGTEILLKEILFPSLREQFERLLEIVRGADLFVTGEVIYTAKSIVEKTGVKWISTSLAPISFFSAEDPSVYPNAQWLRQTHVLGASFHRALLWAVRQTIGGWMEPYRKFRREIGLRDDHDPIFYGKFSDLLHLALFSKVLMTPQPDWHSPTLQAGFCFYDGQQDMGAMPEKLTEFLDAGNAVAADAPIVFTLGSAAVMDARDFFEESARAAQILGRRAVLLYGIFNQPPKILSDRIVGFDYAPYSQIFPRAAAVVHQGGVGTTAQVLRAGVPALFMPYSHDQPDNAFRARRLGTARIVRRERYTAQRAAREIERLLSDPDYKRSAERAAEIIRRENGTQVACDAIEMILKNGK